MIIIAPEDAKAYKAFVGLYLLCYGSSCYSLSSLRNNDYNERRMTIAKYRSSLERQALRKGPGSRAPTLRGQVVIRRLKLLPFAGQG